MHILGWIIIWESLRIILGAKAPWKTVMQSFSNPIQLIRIVSIRAIIYREQVAVRGERHVVSVARAAGQNQSLRSQGFLIIGQNQFGSDGGDAQNPGSEGHVAGIRESARVVFHFTMIGPRAAIDIDRLTIEADNDAVVQ